MNPTGRRQKCLRRLRTHSLWSPIHGEFLLSPLLPLEPPDDGAAVFGAGDEAAARVAPLEAVHAVRVRLLLQNPLRTVLQVRTVHSGRREVGQGQLIIYFSFRTINQVLWRTLSRAVITSHYSSTWLIQHSAKHGRGGPSHSLSTLRAATRWKEGKPTSGTPTETHREKRDERAHKTHYKTDSRLPEHYSPKRAPE